MQETVKVVFRPGGKQYSFSTNSLELSINQNVIVETDGGPELARVTTQPETLTENAQGEPLKKILRTATDEDIRKKCQNGKNASGYLQTCKKYARELNLEMKLISAELNLDGTKITYYFTAEKRVDFRELLKKLCSEIRKKIELRQVGTRDESKIVGGFGACGIVMCCNQFNADFEPISIKAAKEQGLPLNPSKISGACGRLMCCLRHELDYYKEFNKSVPKKGTKVKCGDGCEGVICDFNAIKRTAIVRLENGSYTDIPVDSI